MLNLIISCSKLRIIGIIYSIFSDWNGTKLETNINDYKNSPKFFENKQHVKIMHKLKKRSHR